MKMIMNMMANRSIKNRDRKSRFFIAVYNFDLFFSKKLKAYEIFNDCIVNIMKG